MPTLLRLDQHLGALVRSGAALGEAAAAAGLDAKVPPATERPEAVFAGTAVQLYLSLWNRADEITTDGRPDLIDQWREQIRIRWS
jgi:hypothetical protein